MSVSARWWDTKSLLIYKDALSYVTSSKTFILNCKGQRLPLSQVWSSLSLSVEAYLYLSRGRPTASIYSEGKSTVLNAMVCHLEFVSFSLLYCVWFGVFLLACTLIFWLWWFYFFFSFFLSRWSQTSRKKLSCSKVKKHHCLQRPLCISAAKVGLDKGWETTLAKVSGVGGAGKSISVLWECLKIVLLWFKLAKEKQGIGQGSPVLTLDSNVCSGFSWFLPEAV